MVGLVEDDALKFKVLAHFSSSLPHNCCCCGDYDGLFEFSNQDEIRVILKIIRLRLKKLEDRQAKTHILGFRIVVVVQQWRMKDEAMSFLVSMVEIEFY